jgi:competence protein ComEC
MNIRVLPALLAAALLLPAASAAQTPSAPFAQPAAGTFALTAIDVGTGLAVLVEGHDFTLLYDAGSNDDFARGAANRALAYIRSARPDIAVIDHLILSHPHKDHSELMPDVLTAFQVRNVWNSGSLNNICSYRALLRNVRDEPGIVYHDALGGPGTYSGAFAAKNGGCYGDPAPGVTINVPRGSQISSSPIPLGANAQMTILHADGTQRSSFNAASVVVRLDLGSRHVLLPGDAEAGGRADPSARPAPSSVEGQLLACCASALNSDILVAGHHGSKTSSRVAFLDAVGATTFIVSAGPTKYATVTLPDAEVIREYDRRGTVWRTDLNDSTCGANPAKVGPDRDGRPGGCDNVRVVIGAAGALSIGYDRRHD